MSNDNRANGFTLMEMVITLTVLAILAAVAGPYLTNGVRAYNDTASALHTLGKLRLATERLVRETREIRRDPSGNFDIASSVSSPGSSITFTKMDGETVTIDQSGSVIRLSYSSVPGTPILTDEVKANSLTFSYLQTDGVTNAASNADVAFVEFQLILSHAGNDYPQRSRVALRNLP
jgi:prepilin-type N-terminal cleavage/methylation domain-containing protein